ncbi:MAG TPA: fibronectin type III-like domain-contianing protein, partial [Nocardioidaceae bacterium]|nr:fibronectin type III-like domain-contianing protein [Nocardioidaceae bacterium]
GERPGGHVVQVYATRPSNGEDRGDPRERFLVGFARVELEPAEQVDVRLDVPLRRLARWTGPGHWEVPAGEYRIDVGASASDSASTSLPLEVP